MEGIRLSVSGRSTKDESGEISVVTMEQYELGLTPVNEAFRGVVGGGGGCTKQEGGWMLPEQCARSYFRVLASWESSRRKAGGSFWKTIVSLIGRKPVNIFVRAPTWTVSLSLSSA